MHDRILMAVAPDHMDALPDLLAAARALASEGAEITALSVVQEAPAYLDFPAPVPVYDEARDEIAARLATALDGVEGVRADVRIGTPSAVIEQVCTEGGHDVVIVRSHRPALSDWVLGSTAARVVRRVPCSVHVIR